MSPCRWGTACGRKFTCGAVPFGELLKKFNKMCLYPQRMINKKYSATAKNNGIIPNMPIIEHYIDKNVNGKEIIETRYDTRVKWIEIPCGQCIECRSKKASEWRVRLLEEIKDHKYNYFCTFTFRPEDLDKLCQKMKRVECNAVAGYALRHFLERWRKNYKTSLKHWFITELGHEGTERIHLHGLIFAECPITTEILEKYWKYGNIWVGDYCTEKTINYIVKYMTKIDNDHKGFIGQVLASPGLGRTWVENHRYEPTYRYNKGHTRTDYVLNNGARIQLPTYYKNKLYNEEERELIWRDFMDKEKISIMGNEYSLRTVKNDTLSKISKKAKENNALYGYGNDSKEWRKRDFNVTEKMISKKAKSVSELRKMAFAGQIPQLYVDEIEKNY